MFQEFFNQSSRFRLWMRKGGLITISFFVHALLVLSLIIVPLLRADSGTPNLIISQVSIASTPPPPPPLPAAAKKKGTSVKAETNRPPLQPKPAPVHSNAFVAPIEVPKEIVSENIVDFDLDSGDPNGVDGGIDEGVLEGFLGGVPDGTETQPPSEKVERISVTQAKLIRRVEPIYSPIAIATRTQGTVIIEATTDIYGRVRETHLISGHALLNESALAAVRQWIYSPYLVCGVPKPVKFTVTVTFRLQSN